MRESGRQSHKEIAEELHIAITTIKKHKTNANNYLRERLKGLLCFMMYLGSNHHKFLKKVLFRSTTIFTF
ncbi:MAG: hypothetical protein ACLUDU_20655 [Butyricimonas faecihominis]